MYYWAGTIEVVQVRWYHWSGTIESLQINRAYLSRSHLHNSDKTLILLRLRLRIRILLRLRLKIRILLRLRLRIRFLLRLRIKILLRLRLRIRILQEVQATFLLQNIYLERRQLSILKIRTKNALSGLSWLHYIQSDKTPKEFQVMQSLMMSWTSQEYHFQ